MKLCIVVLVAVLFNVTGCAVRVLPDSRYAQTVYLKEITPEQERAHEAAWAIENQYWLWEECNQQLFRCMHRNEIQQLVHSELRGTKVCYRLDGGMYHCYQPPHRVYIPKGYYGSSIYRCFETRDYRWGGGFGSYYDCHQIVRPRPI